MCRSHVGRCGAGRVQLRHGVHDGGADGQRGGGIAAVADGVGPVRRYVDEAAVPAALLQLHTSALPLLSPPPRPLLPPVPNKMSVSLNPSSVLGFNRTSFSLCSRCPAAYPHLRPSTTQSLFRPPFFKFPSLRRLLLASSVQNSRIQALSPSL